MNLPADLFYFSLLRSTDNSIIGFELVSKPFKPVHADEPDRGAFFCQTLYHNLQYSQSWVVTTVDALLCRSPDGTWLAIPLKPDDLAGLDELLALDRSENCLDLETSPGARDRGIRVVLHGALSKALSRSVSA